MATRSAETPCCSISPRTRSTLRSAESATARFERVPRTRDHRLIAAGCDGVRVPRGALLATCHRSHRRPERLGGHGLADEDVRTVPGGTVTRRKCAGRRETFSERAGALAAAADARVRQNEDRRGTRAADSGLDRPPTAAELLSPRYSSPRYVVGRATYGRLGNRRADSGGPQRHGRRGDHHCIERRHE